MSGLRSHTISLMNRRIFRLYKNNGVDRYTIYWCENAVLCYSIFTDCLARVMVSSLLAYILVGRDINNNMTSNKIKSNVKRLITPDFMLTMVSNFRLSSSRRLKINCIVLVHVKRSAYCAKNENYGKQGSIRAQTYFKYIFSFRWVSKPRWSTVSHGPA